MVKKMLFGAFIISSLILNACTNSTATQNTNEDLVSIQDDTNAANTYLPGSIQTNSNENIIKLYKEFLAGNKSVQGIDINYLTIPTGEPDRHYETKYAIFDSNGDKTPELHVKSARYYYILTSKDNELSIWMDLSPNPYYIPLNNGAFLRYHPESTFNQVAYDYVIYNVSGDEIWSISFYKNYGIDNSNEKNEFYFANVKVTEEQWNALTNQFIYTADDGSILICNEIEWVTLFE